MDARLSFYSETIAQWIPDRGASVLVVAGGTNDRDVFLENGFTNVVISNIDERIRGDEFAPYQWSFQDAESLTYPDGSFDYVVTHAALHHCHSPHRGLLELYRVARRAVVAFEPSDNFLVRLMQRFGLAQVHEQVAVHCNDGKYGGVANTEIPNYIYRWTESEVRKTIHSFAPVAEHRFRFRYGSDKPDAVMRRKGFVKQALISVLVPAYAVFTKIFPKQQNLFAMMVEKPVLPGDLHPWLRMDEDQNLRFNYEWSKERYK